MEKRQPCSGAQVQNQNHCLPNYSTVKQAARNPRPRPSPFSTKPSPPPRDWKEWRFIRSDFFARWVLGVGASEGETMDCAQSSGKELVMLSEARKIKKKSNKKSMGGYGLLGSGEAMDGVQSSGKEIVMLSGAPKIKKKGNKRRKPRPDTDDVCAICDDGGYVTCCDGVCLRSFHLTREHGEASNCRTLGLTTEEAKVIIEKEKFICKNCEYKKHQCFCCELLGSSGLSSGAKVFQCKDANCGHFYHPKCVAELLHPHCKVRATLFEQRVAAGLKFLCPVHKCHACSGAENKDDVNMQFAVCRRCPTTYHRKCLPSDIPFKTENGPNGYIQRAWDGILRDRILMYCTKHVEIVQELGIPMTRPIIFPDAADICVAKGPECVPNERDVLDGGEVMDQPLPLASLPHSPSACIHHRFCSNPDSFVPKSLCMRPYPGSCGWLDDSD